MKQQKIKLTPTVDMIKLQDFAFAAERRAQNLIKKYGGDFKKIKKEIEVDATKDRKFAQEVIWATRWILRHLE